MYLESFVLGDFWLSWELLKRVVHLWVIGIVTMLMLFVVLVLFLVLLGVSFIECT